VQVDSGISWAGSDGWEIAAKLMRVTDIKNQRRKKVNLRGGTGYQYENGTISDLAFRAFCDAELYRHSSSLAASQWITELLKSADRLYLRLGLACPWAPRDSGFGLRCWMQVTGIYTFPDYLVGKLFTDFEVTLRNKEAKVYDVQEIREKYRPKNKNDR
jgi:hypothetical protein